MFLGKKFIKFILVGIINTIFGYSLYALLIYLNLHYSVAVLVGTIVGIMFNFKTTGKLVFNNNENMLLFKFLGVYTVTYILNVSALKIFDTFKFNMYVAGLLLIFPMAAISFTLNSKYVFKEKLSECK